MINISQIRKELYSSIKTASGLSEKQICTNLAPVDENGNFVTLPVILLERNSISLSQRNVSGNSQYAETVFTVSVICNSVETCDNLAYNIFSAIDNSVDDSLQRYYIDEVNDSFYNGKYPISQLKVRVVSTKF